MKFHSNVLAKTRHLLWFASFAAVIGTLPAQAALLLDLDPLTAAYDSDVKGLVNDSSTANESGIPAYGTEQHQAGYTFHIEFVPAAQDLAGTVLLIELGGTANGAGLYLVDGVPTVLSKNDSSSPTYPESLNDTSLPEIAVQNGIGGLSAGTGYAFSASWDHQGNLELIAQEDGQEAVVSWYEISGVPGNWSGNDSLSVGTISPDSGYRGGLSSTAGRFSSSASVQSFSGAISRALFWNESVISSLEPSEPVVLGFGVSRLPTPGQVRLHWNVSPGQVPIDTEIVLQQGAAELARTTESRGFWDGSADEAATFTLVATNSEGSVEATAELDPETPFSALVREDAPVAWFRFNEPEGARYFIDSSGSAEPHDASLLGDPVSGGSGFIDGAAVFDGGSAVVSDLILDPAEADPGYTIETIVLRRAGATGTSPAIASQTDVDGVGRYQLIATSRGTISSFLGGGVRREADARLSAEGWSHLVLVVDAVNTELRWYLDGEFAGTSKDGLNPDGTSFEPNFVLEPSKGNWVFGAGKSLAIDFWEGQFDEIAVYDYLLDDPEETGEPTNERIKAHRDAWWAATSGILDFQSSSELVKLGNSVELLVKGGADVTSVAIDQGVGSLTLVDGSATATVTPTETTTYTVSATTADGTSTRSVTVGVSDDSLLVTDLDSADALYDSDEVGIANDNSSAGSSSGIPALGDAEHVLGYTFNVIFTPTEEDLAGTVLLIELGGTSNGAGLYLVDGVPTLVSKQSSSPDVDAESLQDTSLPAIAVQSGIGPLTAGVRYSFAASWNHIQTLELIVREGNQEPLIDTFVITGTPGNWSGNDTLSVGTNSSVTGSRGALTTAADSPLSVETVADFAGAIDRAVFWNAYSLQSPPTVPQVLGFEATSLPSTGGTRLHWSVSEGSVPTATEIVLSQGGVELHRTQDLTGFVDVTAAPEGVFLLTVENDAGSTEETAETAAETSFSPLIRAAAPVAWFRFNEREGSRLIVDSADNGSPHNGSVVGQVTTGSSGLIDGAAVFEGAGGVLTDLILNPSTADPGFTIEALVRLQADATTGSHTLVGQQDLEGSGRVLVRASNTGEVSSYVGNAPRPSGGSLVPEEWSHLVAVFDAGNAELRWYLDGQPIGSNSDFPIESSLGNWVIGVHKSLTQSFLQGELDELIIYDSLLDDPDEDGDFSDSLVASHRNEWWSRTTGVRYVGTSADAIQAGDSVDLVIRVGADVTAVRIDNGVGVVSLENGRAVVTLTPGTTTTYRITITTPTGTIERTVTVEVIPGSAELRVTSTSIEEGNFVIEFTGAPSRTYVVRGSADLRTFEEDFGTVTTAEDGTGTAVIPIDPSRTAQFFRIEESP